MKLENSFIEYNTSKVQTYSRNGIEIPLQGLEEYAVLRIGNIDANETKYVPLTDFQSPIKPVSIWMLQGDTTENDTTIFYIYYANILLGKKSLSQSEMPYCFPPMVLIPELSIAIQPKKAVQMCFIYFKQVSVIYQKDVDVF